MKITIEKSAVVNDELAYYKETIEGTCIFSYDHVIITLVDKRERVIPFRALHQVITEEYVSPLYYKDDQMVVNKHDGYFKDTIGERGELEIISCYKARVISGALIISTYHREEGDTCLHKCRIIPSHSYDEVFIQKKETKV